MRAEKTRGPYSKTAARRRTILDASIVVFARQGFRKGSIREIADLVGISQAGLLHHFPSKIALLVAVLEYRDARDHEAILAFPEGGISAIRGILDLVRANQQEAGLVDLHCTLSAEATSPDHPARGYFVRRYAFLVRVLTESFEIARLEGQLTPGVEPEGAARGLIAVLDGLQVQWLLSRGTVDMATETRRYLRPLLAVEL